MLSPPLALALVLVAPPLLGFWIGRALAEALPIERSEKIALSFGLSFFACYLVGFAGYLTGIPPFWLHLAAGGAGSALAIWVIGRKKRAVAGPEELRALFGFGLLFLGYGMLQGIFAVYGGGGWYGDWWEHYHRSRFFLDRLPLDTKFLGIYWLPARPPLFNIVTYYFQALFGAEYWIYQILTTMLSLVVVFPLWLICRRLIGDERAWLWWAVVALTALSPIVVRNATYPWPKLLTAYYVLLGLHFYLRARPTGETRLTALAFALGGLGILTHYSAAMVVIPMATDCIGLLLFRPRVQWRSALSGGLAGACVLATWLGWSVVAYGYRVTVASNTTVEWTKDMTAALRAEMALFNARHTLLPYPLWGFADAGEIPRESSLGEWLARLPRGAGHLAFAVPAVGPAGEPRKRWFGVFTQRSQVGLWSDRLLSLHSGTILGNLTLALSLGALWVSWVERPRAPVTRRERARSGRRPRAPEPAGDRPWWARETPFWLLFWPLLLILAFVVTPNFELGGIAHVTLQAPMLLLTGVAFAAVLRARRVWLRPAILAAMAIESLLTAAFMLAVLSRRLLFLLLPPTQPVPEGYLWLGTTPAGSWLLPVPEARFSTVVLSNHTLKLQERAQMLSDRFPSGEAAFWVLGATALLTATAVLILMANSGSRRP